MKKSVLFAVLLALVFPCAVFAGELALFDNGKLSGAKLTTPAVFKDGKMVVKLSQTARITLVPESADLSGYQTLEITLSAQDAGDQYMLVLTSQKPDAKAWSYFYAPKAKLAAGKQVLTFPLIYLERNRQPLGLNNIQRIEMCFAGWDMKLNKNQVLTVEKIRLTGK